MRQICQLYPLVTKPTEMRQQSYTIVQFVQFEGFHLSLYWVYAFEEETVETGDSCFLHGFLSRCQHLAVVSVILVVFSVQLESVMGAWRLYLSVTQGILFLKLKNSYLASWDFTGTCNSLSSEVCHDEFWGLKKESDRGDQYQSRGQLRFIIWY